MRFRNVLFAAVSVAAAVGTTLYVWPDSTTLRTPADAGPDVLDVKILATNRTCSASVFSCPVRLSGAALDWAHVRADAGGFPFRPGQRYIQMRLRSVVCRDEATLSRPDGGGFLDGNGVPDARLANLGVEYTVLDGGLITTHAEREKDLRLAEKEALGMEWEDLSRCDESACDGGANDDALCSRDTRGMALDAFPCRRAAPDGSTPQCRWVPTDADGNTFTAVHLPGLVKPTAEFRATGRATCQRVVCTVISDDDPNTSL